MTDGLRPLGPPPMPPPEQGLRRRSRRSNTAYPAARLALVGRPPGSASAAYTARGGFRCPRRVHVPWSPWCRSSRSRSGAPARRLRAVPGSGGRAPTQSWRPSWRASTTSSRISPRASSPVSCTSECSGRRRPRTTAPAKTRPSRVAAPALASSSTRAGSSSPTPTSSKARPPSRYASPTDSGSRPRSSGETTAWTWRS